MNIMRFCVGLKMAVPLGCLVAFCGFKDTCTASGEVRQRHLLVEPVQLRGLVLISAAQLGDLVFHADHCCATAPPQPAPGQERLRRESIPTKIYPQARLPALYSAKILPEAPRQSRASGALCYAKEAAGRRCSDPVIRGRCAALAIRDDRTHTSPGAAPAPGDRAPSSSCSA